MGDRTEALRRREHMMRCRASIARLASAVPACFVFAVSLLLIPQVCAQVAGATLSGTVTDSSGAVIPKAQVTITGVATGVARTVETDTAGLYTAPNLLPGT